jgi:hypothetical protein
MNISRLMIEWSLMKKTPSLMCSVFLSIMYFIAFLTKVFLALPLGPEILIIFLCPFWLRLLTHFWISIFLPMSQLVSMSKFYCWLLCFSWSYWSSPSNLFSNKNVLSKSTFPISLNLSVSLCWIFKLGQQQMKPILLSGSGSS